MFVGEIGMVVLRQLAVHKARVRIERLPHQPVHVERGQQRGSQAQDVEDHSAAPGRPERRVQYGILAEEARQERKARDGVGADRHHHPGALDLVLQPAHLPHVLLAQHRMDDRARPQEQEGFEAGVRGNVEHAGGEITHAAGKEHIA